LNAQDFSCGYEDLSDNRESLDRNTQAFCAPNEVYWVNLYYHFVSKNDGSGNYTEEVKQPFNGSPNQTGYDRARAIVEEMNRMLEFNPVPDPQIQLPTAPAGTYPNPYYPNQLRFILKGVNFIRDTNLYDNVIGYSQNETIPFETHRINPTNAINVFDTNLRNPKAKNCFCYYTGPTGVGRNITNMVVQRGFTRTKTETICDPLLYPPNTITCALDDAAGLCNCNQIIVQDTIKCCRHYKIDPDEQPIDYVAKLTIHEIGHVLSLNHSWSGVSDLKNVGYSNNNIGNNYMSYNNDRNIDYGFSEQQITRIHSHLNGESSLVYDCSSQSCSIPHNASFLTDLNGNPKSTYAGTKPGWIKVNNFNSFNYDDIRVTVCYLGPYYNTYTSNSPCAANYLFDVTLPSYQNEILVDMNSPDWGKYKVTVGATNAPCYLEEKNFLLTIKPKKKIHNPDILCPISPWGDSSFRLLRFEALEKGNLNIYLIRLRTGQMVRHFVEDEKTVEGKYRKFLNFRNLPPGIYTVLISLNEDSQAILVPNCN